MTNEAALSREELKEDKEMVTRKQFCRLFAERYGVTYRAADVFCRKVFELLGDLIFREDEDVLITGFGSFKHKPARERFVRHPSTGEMIVIRGRDVVKFTPSELFEDISKD